MKIALITAMESEFNALKDIYHFQNNQADVGDKIIYLVKCGMGKVNAAMTAQKLCDQGVDLIFSVGVAGGLDSALKQGDMVLSERVAYHDVWCGEGNLKGQVQNLPLYFETPRFENLDIPGVKKGLFVTGDQFVTDKNVLNQIKANFPEALAVDMESAAIAQVCYLNHIDFASIRIISDVVGEEGQEQMYNDFWKNCPKVLAEAVQMILEKL